MKNPLDILEKHPHYFKLLARLTINEKLIVIEFFQENRNLDKNLFEYKINRMFIDRIEKPKNWSIIMEVLSIVNSIRVIKLERN